MTAADQKRSKSIRVASPWLFTTLDAFVPAAASAHALQSYKVNLRSFVVLSIRGAHLEAPLGSRGKWC
jgi:hypothetical protein